MSNTPNLPRTAWIVCVDVYDKGEGLAYTMTRWAFLDREQAEQYCEARAAESDYKWIASAREWRSSWRRDGDMHQRFHMYINDCPLKKPVAQEVQA